MCGMQVLMRPLQLVSTHETGTSFTTKKHILNSSIIFFFRCSFSRSILAYFAATAQNCSRKPVIWRSISKRLIECQNVTITTPNNSPRSPGKNTTLSVHNVRKLCLTRTLTNMPVVKVSKSSLIVRTVAEVLKLKNSLICICQMGGAKKCGG